MTREEEIKQAAHEWCEHAPIINADICSFKCGAQWADEHPKTMILEWHYPRKDKNDLPEYGSTVLVAEHIPAWESKDHTSYALAINRMYMVEKVTCDLLLDMQQEVSHIYAWVYIEIPETLEGGEK